MDADRQLPRGDEVFLDHVGHFVRDPEAATAALRRAGFAPTPASVHADASGQPTGTGNVTAMLERGYVEILFKTADTEIGREFARSIARYSGLHLIALSVAEAERAHARLAEAGFRLRPIVKFSRPVKTEGGGSAVAAFTVVRLERGEMPEGRIQLVLHNTENTVWQRRWLAHPNGAVGLIDVVIVVSDVAEAAARFGRLTGRTAKTNRAGQIVALDRGAVQLMNEQAFAALLPDVTIPSMPFIAAYGLAVRSLAQAEAVLKDGGLEFRRADSSLTANFPAELGDGAWVFVERPGDLPWRR